MITWFSITHESVDDPRFSFIASNLASLGVRTSDVLALWLRLMHHASKQIDNVTDVTDVTNSHEQSRDCHVTSRGSVTGRDMAILAYSLGIEKVTAESIFSAMIDCKIIINDRFPDWEHSQPKGHKTRVAKTDAERKQDQRMRDKQKNLENMSRNVTESHDVTTEENRIEKTYKDKNIIKKKLKSEEFEKFWKICPRKKAKKNAEKIYEAILKRNETTAEQIYSGMQHYASSVVGKEPQFIAHPSTWLNGGRWGDEYEVTPSEALAMTEEEKLMHRLGIEHFRRQRKEPYNKNFLEGWEMQNNQKVTWINGIEWKKQKELQTT